MSSQPAAPAPDAPRTWGRRTFLAAGALGLAALVAGLATLPQYGITSDEPVAFHAAEWQLWARSANHPERWNFKRDPPAEFAAKANFSTHPDPVALRIPSFPALVGAIVAPLARALPGYGMLDGVHAGLVLLHALVVLGMALYLARLIGLGRALLVAFAYAAYPTVVGHSHYNVKDLPMAGFYALGLLSFAAGLVENRARFIVQSAFWLGLSFASKANAVFAAPTLLLWAPAAGWLLFRAGRLPSRKVVAAVCLIPWIAFLTLWASWPYVRAGTLVEQGTKIGDMLQAMARFSATGRGTFSLYPFAAVATMTPPLLLAGLLLSLGAWRRPDSRDRALLALGWIWFLLPLLRIAAPHSNYYDGNRLFFEYVPALALLAGMGLAWGFETLVRRLPARVGASPWTRRGAVAALAALLLVPLVQYHPYESLYFNLFAGGLGGAQRTEPLTRYCKGMDFYCPDGETDYWGFSFRNAARELNRQAAPNASYAPCGNLIGPLARWQEVRPDIRTVGRDHADWMLIIPRRPFCSEDEQRFARDHGELVREERRDGGLVWALYRRRR